MKKHKKLLTIGGIVLGLIFLLICCSALLSDDETYEDDTYYEDYEEAIATDAEDLWEPTPQEEVTSVENTTTAEVSVFDDEYHNVEGNVSGIAVNQCLSFGIDEDTGNTYYMNSFVEKKETTIFVYLNDAEVIDTSGETQYLDIYRDGELILHRTPDTGNLTTETRLAYSLWGDFRDILTEGNYEIQAVTASGTATRNITLRSTPTMRVLAVPMICNYGGTIVEAIDTWKTAGSFTAAAYPLSYDDFVYELGRTLDVSGAQYDLYTDEGQYNVWCALTALQTQSNDYTMILGFSNGMMGSQGNTGGYTYGAPGNIINSNMLGVPSTVAHEIAHCYLVGDEYDGGAYNFEANIAPYGFSGAEWYNRQNTVTGYQNFIVSGNDYGLRTNGSVIQLYQDPYNLREASTWDASMLPTSFMGGCDGDTNEYWITSAVWEQLYEQFTKTGGGTAATNEEVYQAGNYCPDCNTSMDIEACNWWGICDNCGQYCYLEDWSDEFYCDYCGASSVLTEDNFCIQCPDDNCGVAIPFGTLMLQSQSGSLSSTVATGSGEPITIIDIMGKISPTGFTPNPFYTYDGDTSYITPNKQGDYHIAMTDKDGNTVGWADFAPQFYTDTNPPKLLDEAPINLSLKLPDTAKNIVFYYGETIIHTMEISDHLPVVEVTDFYTDETGKELTVEWAGSDQDGDTLHYEVWYQDYQDTVICLGSDIADEYLTMDMGTLPGTDEDGGYFLIYVTDGINTTYTFSDDFLVDWKAPEFVSPHNYKDTYLSTDEVAIDLDAYDMQEGWLMDADQIIWFNEAGEIVDRGAPLLYYPYELTPNKTHTFTCMAKNQAGLSTTTEISFFVEDNSGALEDTWYKTAVEYSLSSGYILPFTNAETSYVTRYDLAKALFMLELYYGGEMEPPEFDDTLVTDLTADLDPYEPFFAVYKGYMEAPGGKFDPYAKVTEAEALDAFYEIMSAYADLGTDDKMEAMTDWEIIDDIAENDYQPNNNLTRAKMFYRFFSAVYLLD